MQQCHTAPIGPFFVKPRTISPGDSNVLCGTRRGVQELGFVPLALTGLPQVLGLAGCEFQAPQKCLRLINVYAISFIPVSGGVNPRLNGAR